MGGRILGDLCGAAGLYSRSGSIQQKAKRIHEFFQTGANITAPTGESVEPASSHDYGSNDGEGTNHRDMAVGDVNVRGHASGFEDYNIDLQVGSAPVEKQKQQAAKAQPVRAAPVHAGDLRI